jgi:hypothetical protein
MWWPAAVAADVPLTLVTSTPGGALYVVRAQVRGVVGRLMAGLAGAVYGDAVVARALLRWDSGVRKALKAAPYSIRPDGTPKEDPDLDFPGFGPHSLRRANITWRQEVGGSSIESSKIAGHASTAITEEYTFVQLKRQDELTRRIQDKRAKAAKKDKDKKVVEIKSKETAA